MATYGVATLSLSSMQSARGCSVERVAGFAVALMGMEG